MCLACVQIKQTLEVKTGFLRPSRMEFTLYEHTFVFRCACCTGNRVACMKNAQSNLPFCVRFWGSVCASSGAQQAMKFTRQWRAHFKEYTYPTAGRLEHSKIHSWPRESDEKHTEMLRPKIHRGTKAERGAFSVCFFPTANRLSERRFRTKWEQKAPKMAPPR